MNHSSIRPLILAGLVSTAFISAGCSSDTSPQTAPVAKSVTDSKAPQQPTGEESAPAPATAALPEVIIETNIHETIEFLKGENWWGQESRDQQLTVPHLMITAIHPSWQEASKSLTVQDKKEVFYRLMLPLVMHANDMITHFRTDIEQAKQSLAAGEPISPENLAIVQRTAVLLPNMDDDKASALTAETPELAAIIDELLYRLDIVPAGLALGQAAYESGYGTSRFAVQGNSLFGQWTYKGDGLVPGKQRKELGNHQIKAFEWPFDSVRGYFINLMTHPAYEDFRRLRAEMRAAGKPIDSLVLADGLIKYSERGQEYVDSLKGMIRVNKLTIADNAVFRDEPMRFLLSAKDDEDAAQIRNNLENKTSTGEIQEILERMRLE